jgi:FkbM family methyltransferase
MSASDWLARVLLRIGTACRIRGLLLQEQEYLRRRSTEPAKIGWADIFRRPERAEIPIRVARFIPPSATIHLIDVGANDGQWASRFLQSFPNTTAELWEPLPQLVELLQRQFSDRNRVTIIPAAASSSSGHAKIVEPQHDAMASLHDYADLVAKSSKHGTARSLDIRLDRLDDQDRLLEGRLIVLKIDAQGHELEVLEGARKILPNVSLAIVEASIGEVFKARPPTFSSVCGALEPYGLYPVMFPSAGTLFGNHPLEQDILFVRRDDLYKLSET